MQIPILWFETVNRKFASEIFNRVNEDCKTNQITRSEIQVLLTEIIIPVQLGFEEEANQRIASLRKIKSLEKFSEAASKIFCCPYERCWWKIKWQNLSTFLL